MATIIWLHGASSSGKSTIARALQTSIEEPFWHYSIDHLRDAGVLPMDRIRRDEFPWPTLRRQFFEGFHHSIGAFADAGNNLILEHILEGTWRVDLTNILSRHDVFFVGVRCGLAELVRRELARGDRPVGSAAADYVIAHQGLRYDLELQSEDGIERNLELLLTAWRGRGGQSALFLSGG